MCLPIVYNVAYAPTRLLFAQVLGRLYDYNIVFFFFYITIIYYNNNIVYQLLYLCYNCLFIIGYIFILLILLVNRHRYQCQCNLTNNNDILF